MAHVFGILERKICWVPVGFIVKAIIGNKFLDEWKLLLLTISNARSDNWRKIWVGWFVNIKSNLAYCHYKKHIDPTILNGWVGGGNNLKREIGNLAIMAANTTCTNKGHFAFLSNWYNCWKNQTICIVSNIDTYCDSWSSNKQYT